MSCSNFQARLMFRPLLAALAAAALLLPIGCGGGGGGGGDGGTAPQIVSTVPADGATDVPVDLAEFVVNFSSPMDSSSFDSPGVVTMTGIDESYFGEPSWSSDYASVTIPLLKGFTEGHTVTLTFNSVATGTNGLPLVSEALTFTTVITVPYVVGTSPSNLDTNVPTDTIVEMVFSEPMDTTSFEGNSFAPNISNISAEWSSNDTILTLTFDPLASDTTYSLTLLPGCRDKGTTSLAEAEILVFSTGGSFASGAIGGVISDDPLSPADDGVTFYAAAFTVDPMAGSGDAEPVSLAPCDAAGAFTISYLPDGTYYLLGIGDTNGDGELDPELGDAIGIYAEIHPDYILSPVTVSGDAVTGINFTLKDTEAITGVISFDSPPGTVDPDIDVPWLYAYIGSSLYRGQMRLSSEGADPFDVAEYRGEAAPETWKYILNAAWISGIGATGSFANMDFSTTDRESIPAGDYSVFAILETDLGETYGGFAASTASIATTGDDAIGADITLYQLITPLVGVEKVSSLDTQSEKYGSATVTLLGWPVWEFTSNGTYYDGDYWDTGVAYLLYSPVDYPVALHAEPDPADAASFLPVNRNYDTFDSSADFNFVTSLPIVSRAIIRQLADLPGGPGASGVNFARAFIAGSAQDGNTSDNIVGATVTVPGGTVYYVYDTGGGNPGLTTSGGTRDVSEMPQFFVFNMAIPADEIGTIRVSANTYDDETAVIPLRAGELSTAEAQMWLSGD